MFPRPPSQPVDVYDPTTVEQHPHGLLVSDTDDALTIGIPQQEPGVGRAIAVPFSVAAAWNMLQAYQDAMEHFTKGMLVAGILEIVWPGIISVGLFLFALLLARDAGRHTWVTLQGNTVHVQHPCTKGGTTKMDIDIRRGFRVEERPSPSGGSYSFSESSWYAVAVDPPSGDGLILGPYFKREIPELVVSLMRAHLDRRAARADPKEPAPPG